MRVLLLLWMVTIFIVTSTNDVSGLLMGKIKFVFDPNPEWDNLFVLYPISDISNMESLGHFLMFFVLISLLMTVSGKIIRSGVIAILYGMATEILQLYFGRGAEVYDILADVSGVLVFMLLYGMTKSMVGVHKTKDAKIGSVTMKK